MSKLCWRQTRQPVLVTSLASRSVSDNTAESGRTPQDPRVLAWTPLPLSEHGGGVVDFWQHLFWFEAMCCNRIVDKYVWICCWAFTAVCIGIAFSCNPMLLPNTSNSFSSSGGLTVSAIPFDWCTLLFSCVKLCRLVFVQVITGCCCETATVEFDSGVEFSVVCSTEWFGFVLCVWNRKDWLSRVTSELRTINSRWVYLSGPKRKWLENQWKWISKWVYKESTIDGELDNDASWSNECWNL